MREIRTSGLMSGDGKRSVAAWPKPPRPSSTLRWPSLVLTVNVISSAVSKDMLVQRFQGFASEVLVHPVHELIGRQRPIRLDDGPFAMQPARLDRVEPGAFSPASGTPGSGPRRCASPGGYASQSTPAPLD